MENFFKQLLKVALERNPQCKMDFSTKHGCITEICLFGPNLGLQFFNAGKVCPAFFLQPNLSNEENMNSFKHIVYNIQRDFDVNILLGYISSLTQLSKIYFTNFLCLSQKFGYISVDSDLHLDISKSPKYGLLFAKQCIVSPLSHDSCYFSLDFKKFYLNLLHTSTPFLSTCLPYHKIGLHFKPMKKPNTYFIANIFLATLKSIIDYDLHYSLFGKEFRFGAQSIPIDAIILPHSSTKDLTARPSKKNNVIAFNYHGCFHHGCQESHHLPDNLQEKDHKKNCIVCSKSVSSDNVCKPQLWKLRDGTNFDSIHPYKRISYRAVNEKSKEIEQKLKSDKQFNSVIILYECQLLQFWTRPVSELLNFLNLTPKTSIDLSQTLQHCFITARENQFPLFKRKDKMNMQDVITAVKQKTFFGFLKISGALGQKSKILLKDFPPFSHLDENGKIFNSFEFKDELVTSDFLAFLLNNKEKGALPDFSIFNISKIYFYPRITENPYAESCENLLKLMKTNQHDGSYLTVLKAIANFYVGNYSQCPNNYKTSFLMESKDFLCLNQLKNFICMENITNDTHLVHFKTNQSYSNCEQNNLAIVQRGRMTFIQFIVSFLEYLQFDLKNTNTDGCIITGTKSMTNLPAFLPGVLALDILLKPNLSLPQIESYVSLKEKYFSEPMVCILHRKIYKESLMQQKYFIPQECCKKYTIKDHSNKFQLKVENFGEIGAIFGINKSFLVQQNTNDIVIKCSGLKNKDDLSSFVNFCRKDITTIFNNLSKVN